ncbi:MAG: histidine phosphatase family protein [Alcanivorax sp.]|nr:histidine phosphatase family protein [Alcanivorax sp.]
MTTTMFDLIRHGEPAGGPMYRGHQDDPLSPRGWQQMRAAIGTQDDWDHILSSPLLRCREFAHELGQRLHRPVTVADNFKEISFGDWEGLTRQQVDDRFGDHQANFWRDAENHTPPNAETIQAFHQRIGAAWQQWNDTLKGQRVLLVCHGGVIRIVLAHALGLTPGRAMGSFQVPYACRTRLRIEHGAHGPQASLLQHGSQHQAPAA